MDSIVFFTFCVILITDLVLSSPSSQYPGKIDCQNRDNTAFTFNYKVTVTSRNESRVNARKWKLIKIKSGKHNYWVETCTPSFNNGFCDSRATHKLTETKMQECKRSSGSTNVVCNIAIPSTEITSTNPKMYAVFVNYNATHAWKRKIKFLKVQLNVEKPNCSYNETHMNIITKSKDTSKPEIKLSLLNNRVVRDFNDFLAISRKELKEINFQNVTANRLICGDGRCSECGVRWSFFCNPKHPTSVSHSENKSVSSTSIIVTISTIGGLLFVAMCTSLFWFVFVKRKKNLDLIQPPNNEPIYEELQEPHVYDKPNI